MTETYERPRTGKQALWNTDHEHVPGWAKMPPEERKRREDAALAYSSAEVEVGIVSVKATPVSAMALPKLLGMKKPP